MFKLDDVSDTYEYPVKFSVVDAKGRQQNHSFTAFFKRLDREEIVDRVIGDDSPTRRTGEEVIEADLDYILGFMTDWKGVDVGGDTTFGRDNLRKMISRIPNLASVIGTAFIESSNGGRQRKN
jgi:hypothetical protein